MLVCPHCENQVNPNPGDEWFLCPHCEFPIRKQLNRNGNSELQPGIAYRRVVRIMQYLTAKPPGNPTPTTKIDVPRFNLKNLLIPFGEIQAKLDSANARINVIDSTKRNLGSRINVLTRTKDASEKFYRELKSLDDEREIIEDYKTQLKTMENYLIDERRDAVQKSNNSGAISSCSLILVPTGLVLFALVTAAVWNWKSVGVIIIVTMITVFVLYNVANSSGG